MRIGTVLIGLACLVGFAWLAQNIEGDDLTKWLIVGVLGLSWCGVVFVGAGIVAAILGALGIASGKVKE